MKKTIASLLATSCVLAACSEKPAPIRITGSSTVYPFTAAVADSFAGKDGNVHPLVQSAGTIAGMKTFCAGPGAPDLLDASRRITRDDLAACTANKVGDVLEIPIGLDGIAVAEAKSGPKLAVTTKDLYLALAANPMGKPNSARTWRDVNPALPALPIKVLGPPESSGTRAAFVTLLIEPGCLVAMPEAQTLRTSGDPAKFDMTCSRLRNDGAFVSEGEDDNAIVTALERDPKALGVFGYSYLERNLAQLRAVPIGGVAPDATTIANGTYPGVRQLYLYVKKAHMEKKPAIKTFLNLYLDMAAANGPLARAGLIPLSEKAAARARRTIEGGFPVEPAALP
ncbi:phosphate ABC transporter substrate-binding protein [Sphingomonas ginsenosidimutans]|jgi:phosphate transport system substrate-binding protein|uniref:Phosphate ABC transporter substrate-binding protein n=1 Tax=Sphingomonas ginsenosidimutans TaxID=862134 RepID=A0A2A4HXY0_9SPHN|nr:substrate-binding domain-containing protein [Sphingomonas ginsenosidimutans]PCG08538.1 phosphate ABC transporter substrate-binding protein [Sphingomonas ginsenosidimutans]